MEKKTKFTWILFVCTYTNYCSICCMYEYWVTKANIKYSNFDCSRTRIQKFEKKNCLKSRNAVFSIIIFCTKRHHAKTAKILGNLTKSVWICGDWIIWYLKDIQFLQFPQLQHLTKDVTLQRLTDSLSYQYRKKYSAPAKN